MLNVLAYYGEENQTHIVTQSLQRIILQQLTTILEAFSPILLALYFMEWIAMFGCTELPIYCGNTSTNHKGHKRQ